MLGIDVPIFAFSHCRDVVAAVSAAGGMGVLGGSRYSPEQLDQELAWIDSHVGGRPYGVDLVMPARQAGKEVSGDELDSLVPHKHMSFVNDILQRYHVITDTSVPYDIMHSRGLSTRPETIAELIGVAFEHPIKLLASALGPPAPEIVDRCKDAGITVAALAGTARHAVRHVAAGAEIVVAAGYEAGGHTGEIGTMVLTPEVVDAVAPVPVLAAGGIATGRQVAAALALGAAGVWTGSVWLTTQESEVGAHVKQKMVAASSSDTLRSKTRTGKPARQLRSAWHDEWDAHPDIEPLPMPLQGMLSETAFLQIARAADANVPGAQKLDSYFVGQAVGLMSSSRKAREVFYDLVTGLREASEHLWTVLESED
jgi:NAD(P)H-dependent flavin oxidoreductase YrpB (nitropropane dioxygenase family)